MAPQGTKRASPGAEEEKSPLDNVELTEESANLLSDIQKDIQRTEIILGQCARSDPGLLQRVAN
jgi:template-activating factor I